MKSILNNQKECYFCKTTIGLARHHIFGGRANRKISEQEGCWVWLCGYHHNLSNQGVHFNKQLDLELKEECQKRWEEINGTREDFRRLFGKSWL